MLTVVVLSLISQTYIVKSAVRRLVYNKRQETQYVAEMFPVVIGKITAGIGQEYEAVQVQQGCREQPLGSAARFNSWLCHESKFDFSFIS